MTTDVRHEFFESRGTLIFALAISLFLVAFGAWTFFIHISLVITVGIWVLLASIPMSIHAIRRILDKSPSIVLTKTRIEHKHWPFKYIEWNCVRHVFLRKICVRGMPTDYINFETTNEDNLLSQMPFLSRITWKAGKLFGFSAIAINLTPVKAIPDQFEKTVLSYLKEARNIDA